MNRQGFFKGVIIPVSIVLAAAVLSGIGYFGPRGVDNDTIRPIMAPEFNGKEIDE